MNHPKPVARPRSPVAALLAGLVLALGLANARADGSRDLFPAGYVGSRANLDLQPAQAYVGVVRRRTFIYVYAQAGEYILLGSSNRIDGNTAGNIRVYNPQNFGVRGDETIPATSDFDCVNGATGGATGPHFSGDPAGAGNITGAIATRAAELAGPRSADNSAGAANAWIPCAYRAPTTGLYGVLFAVSDGGAGPNGAIDPPARSNTTVAAWEVLVRANAASTTDLTGRAFTYAFAFFTGANNRPVNSDLYYVTGDGFRYQQVLRDFDPNGYALYANVSGFLDGGNPLYRNVRGGDATVFPFVPAGTGIVAPPAQYPAFFVDVDPAGPNAAQVAQVLGALSIPLVPPTATLDATTFAGAIGSGQTVVNLGGTFTLTTTNTITFQIVISRDGVNFDPATPLNRTLTGFAPGGVLPVAWDGNDNAGNPFPTGSFPYRVEGRNGDVHFPMIDAEGNLGGGPTIVRLNGPGTALARRTVFFDDRGYRTTNGTLVGVLNGTLCPPGSGGTPPSPPVGLLGVDSATGYRSWPGNGNSNADCVVGTTTQGFGDAKGLDLWTHVATAAINQTIEILGSQADLSVTKTDGLATVAPGAPINYTIAVANAGPSAANNAVLTDPAVANLTVTGVTCGPTTGGAACPAPAAVTVAALQGSGIVIPTFPPGSSVTFTVTGTAGAAGSIVNTARIDPPTGTVDPNPGNNNATDTTAIVVPELALAKSNGTTTVLPGASTTYTVTVSNIGAAATTGTIGVTDVLPAGITIAAGAVPLSGANAADWTCSAAAQVITCGSTTAIGAGATSVFAFTATVAANASGTLVNRARVGGGGDPLNPNPPNEGDTAVCTANGTPRGCAIDTDSVPTPQVAISKTRVPADATVAPGGVATWTVIASNTGLVAANGSIVNDAVPAGTTTFNWTCSSTPAGLCPLATGSGAIGAGNGGLLASFPPGAVVTWTIQATVSNTTWPANIVNQARLDPPAGSTCQPGNTAPPCLSQAITPVVCAATTGGVAGLLWHDLVADGVFDPDGADNVPGNADDERPLRTLLSLGAPGAPLSATRLVSAGADGRYSFANVAPGTYELTTLDAYLGNNFGLYPLGTSRRTVVVQACGVAVEDFRYGAAALGVVGDFVWFDQDLSTTVNEYYDADGNGQLTDNTGTPDLPADLFEWVDLNGNTIPDAGEFNRCGLGGVPVELRDAGGGVLGSTTTDLRGAYFFTGLPLGASYTTAIDEGNPATFARAQQMRTSGLCRPFPPTAPSATGAAPRGVIPTGCGNTTGTSRVSSVLSAAVPVDERLDFGLYCFAASQLSSVKSVNAGPDGFASPGEVLTYSIVVSNSGGTTTTPVVVSDPIPANTTYVGGSATGPGASFAANTVTWTIPAGASFPVTLSFQVTVANPIPPGVTSILNTHTLDGQPGCGTPPCTTTPTQPAVASVKSVNAGADNVASPGEVLTYSIVVSNSGGPTTAPVVVTDPIPANTTYVGGSATGPGASFAANTVTWTIPPAASFPVTLNFQVTVANPIPPGVTSILNTHALDGQPGCGTPPCTTTPTPSSVTIAKSVADASGNGLAEPGETLVYTITLANSGGTPASNVSVTDPLDPNTLFVSASNGGTFAAGSVTWTGLTVPANGSLALTLTVTVANPLAAGVTQIRNAVVITGNPLPDCSVASPPANCTSLPVPRIALTKVASSSSVQVPGSVLYTITVRNVGGAAIANVTISDPLPTGISQFTWTCSGTGVACPAASGTGAISQTVPSFPLGAQLVYAVTATVAANAPANIVNSVTVTPSTVVTCSPSNQPAPCRADAPVTTAQVPTAVPFADPRTLVLLALVLFGFGMLATRRVRAID